MKGKKDIAILFFIIVVLVFYIFSEDAEKLHYDLPDIGELKTEDISRLVITKPDAEIELVREGGEWFVGPEKYPAARALAENMLKNISEIKINALASESGSYSVYKLDAEQRIEAGCYKNSELVRKVYIGKTEPSYSHTFVMIDKDPRIFHAGGDLRREFNKTIEELRDRKVMTFSDEINSLKLRKGDDEIKISRTSAPVSIDTGKDVNETAVPDEEMPKWTDSEGSALKEAEIDMLITTLSDLVCDGYIEDTSRDDLHSPVFIAELNGINTYKISLFAEKDGKFPAVSSESDYPFFLSKWKAERIMKDFESLREVEK